MISVRIGKPVLAILAALALAADATAGLNVTPTRVHGGGEEILELRIANTGDDTRTLQIDPYSWSQSGGDDVLDGTDELIVSPRVAEIPPGSAQVVRLQHRSPAERQQAYRLLVTDITAHVAQEPGISVAARISLPVFIGGPAGPGDADDLGWESTPEGIRATNGGDGYVVVSGLSADGAQIGGRRYVLPGATREWEVGEVSGQVVAAVGGESVEVMQ